MKGRAVPLALVLAVAGSVAGCGTGARDAGASAAPVSATGGAFSTLPPTTPPAPTRPAARAPGGPSIVVPIGSADNGRTVAVRIGDTIRLLLDDPGVQWTSPKATPAALLVPDPAPSPPPRGQLVIWRAVQRGSVKVTAVATAWCAAGAACPMYARLFAVTALIS